MKKSSQVWLSLIVQCCIVSLCSASQVVALTSNSSVEYGDAIIFTCVATGGDASSITFSWYKDSVPLVGSTRVAITNDSMIVEEIEFSLSYLELCNATVSDVGRYTCEVSNGSFSSMSDTHLSIANLTLQVVAISNSTSVQYGSSTVLTCRGFSGPADVTISWQRNGQTISNDSNNIITFDDLTIAGEEGTFQVSHLQLYNVRESGIYTCVVSNGIATESSEVMVTVPEFTLQVAALTNATTVEYGDSVLLTCVGYGGSDMVTVSWQNNGQTLTNDSNYIIESEELTIDGVEGTFQASYLQLCTVRDDSNYTCLVNNGFATTSADIVLTVSEFTLQVAALTNATTVEYGDSVLLTCVGYGGSDMVTVSWQNNGQTLTNDSNYIIESEELTIDGVEGTYQASYLQLCTVRDDGNYTCLVNNGFATTSADVALTVSGVCRIETQQVAVDNQIYGSVNWPRTKIGDTVEVTCPCEVLEVSEKATRVCGGDNTTGALWLQSNTSNCLFSDFKRQACTSQNLTELTRIFEESPEEIDVEDIDIFDDMITTTMSAAIGNATVSDSLLDIINSILHTPVEVLEAAHRRNKLTSRLLENIDTLINGYPIINDSVSVVRSMFGCLVHKITASRAFSFRPGLGRNNEILLDSANPFAAFSLPSEAIDQANPKPELVTFCAFMNNKLFTRRNSYLTRTNRTHLEVGGLVISSHFEGNIIVKNLQNEVTLNFTKREGLKGSVECSFWDQSLDEGFGAWSTEGCFLAEDNSDTTACRCNHLTNFAILVDPTNPTQNPTNPTQNPLVDQTNPSQDPSSLKQDQHIGGVMILGPIILLICAIFTFICAIITRELRSTPTGIFLCNLCVTITSLCIVFIIAYFVGGHTNFCAFMAFMIHYCVLVVCLALATMAFFVGFTPFPGKKQTILQIAGIVNNWVLPLIIVIICIASATDDYRPGNPDYACRPDSFSYWIGLLMIGGLLLVITAILLIAILVRFKMQLIPAPRSTAYKWYLDFFGLLLVAACFYVAWGFGLPAMRPLDIGAGRIVFQIIFILFCILCGILMVVFFCLLSPPVREVLSCGYYKQDEDTTDTNKKPTAGIDNNVYHMEVNPTKDDGTIIKNESVNYTFSENLYEEPEPSKGVLPGVELTFIDPIKGAMPFVDN